MADLQESRLISAEILMKAGLRRRSVQLKPRRAFFRQGDVADCVYFIESGRAKLIVVSNQGKEATIALLAAGDFVGEESIASAAGLRMASATAITSCTALKIERTEMIRAMREDQAFSDLFLKFLLARSMRTQADLVDQLFNSSEKRLARILLLMAEFGQPIDQANGEDHPIHPREPHRGQAPESQGAPVQQETLIPKISQETLAEMIGTTRSRVSFFMNRFRKLGFIEYNGGIRVHKSLLNVILHDSLNRTEL